MELFPIGCETLDKMIGGGLPSQALSLAYGEAGCGKSTLAMQAAVNCARRGFKAIYVDADQSFSHQRLSQIAHLDAEEAGERIIVFFPETFQEQTELIENLESYVTKAFRMVILDSVTNLYRVAILPGAKSFKLNRELNRQLAYLADLASNHDLAVLTTGQVHAMPSAEEARIEPVARRIVFHWPKVIMNLRSTARQDVKDIVVEKSFEAEDMGSCLVKITDRGVEPYS